MSESAPTCIDFDRWAGANLDTEWWRDHEERWLAFAYAQSPEAFAAARRSATRAAALLGALPDRLVHEDHGVTCAVAREQPGWRKRLQDHNEELLAAFELQLDTYRLVELRAVAGAPPDEELVKLLHQLVCRNQPRYLVSEDGRLTRRPLPRGRYKSGDNYSPCRRRGPRYVDVGMVDKAMRHFVAELETDAFASAHPSVQAAYALHTMLAIHPFADGNGRVARALASLYVLRALALPFFLEFPDRRGYLDALRCADDGDMQPLVQFVVRRCGETVSFALDYTADARPPTLDTR